MKTIKCDLCKREIGKEVDYGSFISLGSGTNYRSSDFFDSGIVYKEKTISDLCSECFIKIAEAQNKIIEEIRSNSTNQPSIPPKRI